ncbi:MAG TPA: D-Ala-D-Ala carboxypeptidase family metallohydrolase, partial [Paracoccaceae bacterium]|nr:D-Ala-D-Ala carboxypeptidase family metallohydrolase [Paracoccaceae bacterium]
MTVLHFSQVARDDWPSVYFTPQEVACRRTGRVLLTGEVRTALRMLDDLRRAMGHPLILNSGYRSPEHNAAVGGARNSLHLRGLAFDVRMANVDPHRFEAEARRVGFTGIGIYARSGFIHVDARHLAGMAPWRAVQQGAEFPRRVATRFGEVRPAPAREAAREVAPVVGIGGAAEAVITAAEPALREVAPWLPGQLQGWAIAAAAAAAVALVVLRLWQRHR